MSDNGKLVLPEGTQPEKKPVDLLIVQLDEEGRIRIDVKTGDERLLILVKHYVEHAIVQQLNIINMKNHQIQVAQSVEAQSILNRMRGIK